MEGNIQVSQCDLGENWVCFVEEMQTQWGFPGSSSQGTREVHECAWNKKRGRQ